MTKKIYVDVIRFSAIAHLQKAHITNERDSGRYFAYRLKYYHLLNEIRHPPPFNEEKNSSNLKDCQIFKVIKVLRYSKIGVY